ncbi:Uncharacterised protein [Vibrio cholerae]|nr:Uncharacterised protein [Vibrio cholerae]
MVNTPQKTPSTEWWLMRRKWANHRLWSMTAQDSSLTAYSSLTLQALAY